MTRDEADRLVAALALEWPEHDFDADAWWNSVFVRVAFDDALATVLELVEQETEPPTPARFGQYRRSGQSRTVNPTTPAQQARGNSAIAKVRAELAQITNPWGSIEKPTRPAKDWVPRHTGDVEGGTWRKCAVCWPEGSAA